MKKARGPLLPRLARITVLCAFAMSLAVGEPVQVGAEPATSAVGSQETSPDLDPRQLRPLFQRAFDGQPVHPSEAAPLFSKFMQLPSLGSSAGATGRAVLDSPCPATVQMNVHSGRGANLGQGEFEFSITLKYEDDPLAAFVGTTGFHATLTIRGEGTRVRSAGLVLFTPDSHSPEAWAQYSMNEVTTLGSAFVVTEERHARHLRQKPVSASQIRMVIRTIDGEPAREKAYVPMKVAAEFKAEPFQPIADLYFGS